MKEYSYNIINDVYNWMISRKKDILISKDFCISLLSMGFTTKTNKSLRVVMTFLGEAKTKMPF